MEVVDLTEQRFGKLMVIGRVENSKSGKARWLCLCDCETEIVVLGDNLTSGNTKSCGCLAKNNLDRTVHGHTKGGKFTSTYSSWQHMMRRCYNPNDIEYPRYGGRDKTVCDRWHKFENFLEDMGECPEGLTIERVNNEGHYELSNCKWDTKKNQARNRSSNIVLTLNGESHLMIEWAEMLGWSEKTLSWRKRNGWSDKKILTTDPKIYHEKVRNRGY